RGGHVVPGGFAANVRRGSGPGAGRVQRRAGEREPLDRGPAGDDAARRVPRRAAGRDALRRDASFRAARPGQPESLPASLSVAGVVAAVKVVSMSARRGKAVVVTPL